MPTARWPEGADFAHKVPTNQCFPQLEGAVFYRWAPLLALATDSALINRGYLTAVIDDTQVHPGPTRVVLASARIAQ
jgi:hypothetical protein